MKDGKNIIRFLVMGYDEVYPLLVKLTSTVNKNTIFGFLPGYLFMRNISGKNIGCGMFLVTLRMVFRRKRTPLGIAAYEEVDWSVIAKATVTPHRIKGGFLRTHRR